MTIIDNSAKGAPGPKNGQAPWTDRHYPRPMLGLTEKKFEDWQKQPKREGK